jgi:hypothetical protein
MYRKERLDVFLGFNVSAEVNSEVEKCAARALSRKSDFLRLLLAEGLNSWRLGQLRAGRAILCNEIGQAAGRLATKRGE